MLDQHETRTVDSVVGQSDTASVLPACHQDLNDLDLSYSFVDIVEQGIAERGQ